MHTLVHGDWTASGFLSGRVTLFAPMAVWPSTLGGARENDSYFDVDQIRPFANLIALPVMDRGHGARAGRCYRVFHFHRLEYQ